MSGRSEVLAVRPRAGSAVLFWNDLPDGSPNRAAWHAGCAPVGGGARVVVQKFKEPLDGGARHDREPGWARYGCAALRSLCD